MNKIREQLGRKKRFIAATFRGCDYEHFQAQQKNRVLLSQGSYFSGIPKNTLPKIFLAKNN